MPRQVQIGNTIYTIPEENDNPGWGEDLTEYLTAIADALESVQGANDILLTSATLANNQTVAANIPELVFNTSQVQGIEVDFLIERTFDAGASIVTESGKVIGSYNGVDFKITTESEGDAGIALSITPGGQFQYTSTDLTNHVTSVIRFRGRTIDQP